jgi:tetratricopeptide (TPR) repeat protein
VPEVNEIANPFDFANPVSDSAVFAGRDKELADISYYLDYAKKSPRPINVALLGGRASGKTSLLNMIEIRAKESGLLTVRIELDEGDAEIEANFFFKLFDNLIFAACEAGAFGGSAGRTYETYLDMMHSFSIPEDKTFCPFVFPINYAKGSAAGHPLGQVSVTSVKHDLQSIHGEVKRGIVLLFDEANVLAASRVHLQKLRNIFMNMEGYMLVLAGTPDLFSAIDDVFSPIIRQFKKINVGTFLDVKDTEECVKKRLEAVGLVPTLLLRSPVLLYTDVHRLSGGRPYEIQLICHVMFRRVQEKRASRMQLDFGVLEEVRRELEVSQDMSTRPLLTRIRNLNEPQLRALATLLPSDAAVSFDHSWSLEYLSFGTSRWTKESLEEHLRYLEMEAILTSHNGIIRFAGDDFDKIYTRYFAGENKVSLGFAQLPFDDLASFTVDAQIARLTNLESITSRYGSKTEDEIPNVAKRLVCLDPKDDPFVDAMSATFALYHVMLRYRGRQTVPVLNANLNLPWLKSHYWYCARDPRDSSELSIALTNLQGIVERAQELGGVLNLQVIEFQVPTVESLSELVLRTANEKARERVSHIHYLEVVDAYLSRRVDDAAFAADLLTLYQKDLSAEQSNNLGYLYMSIGNVEKAKALFEQSVLKHSDNKEDALPRYNLGVLEAKQGNYDIGIEQLESARRSWVGQKLSRIECLFALVCENGDLRLEEEFKPNPQLLVDRAIEAIRRVKEDRAI